MSRPFDLRDLSPLERLARRMDHLVLKPVKYIVIFRCPVCGNKVKHDGEGMSPVCTGPHPSLNEHEMEPMVRIYG